MDFNVDSVKSYLEEMNKQGYKEKLLKDYYFEPDDLVEIQKQITDIENDNFSNPSEKGRALENLARSLFCFKNLFNVQTNIFTSTNEVDLLLIPNPGTLNIMEVFFRDICGFNLIGECKNYNDKIGVTWIGKVHSLLKVHNYNMCVLFSRHGFTGKKWEDGKGLARKVALKENIFILDITFNDLNKLEKKTIFDLITEKYNDIYHDIDYSAFLTTHPSERK
ncbi:hypothetical protein [Enterococcus gallinarum]|uniref:hypothetical protein n=1 Tax=Enterococcus gallinarum TaxID=1353 RepID=UPI003D6C0F69